MKIIYTIKHVIMYKLGFFPRFAKYIFFDADTIFRKFCELGVPERIKHLTPVERRTLHFSFGTDIRNTFLLWHPKNPHTMLKLAELSDERQADSPFHPDNYSWGIISRLVVAAGVTDSQTSSDFDASESLLYSLLTCPDDRKDTLECIESAVTELVNNERWDLLDQVFEETLLYNPSPAKLNVLLNGLGDNATKITPINYLRIAQRAIGYGVVVHHNKWAQPGTFPE